MAFRKSNVGWKKRFKQEEKAATKTVVAGEPKLRWTPGKPGNPMRHTFSADHFQKRQRVGYVARQDPSLIRRLKNDIDDLSLPQHVVVAKSRARQDMALTKLTGVLHRYINKSLMKALFYWKYGALSSLQRRTLELEEALESSNDLNEHLEKQLKECNLKLENMITTDHLTKRKSQKAMNVASTKQTVLAQTLSKAQNDIKRLNGQKKYLIMRMRKMGTQGFLRSLWRCNTRAAFRTWQHYHLRVGHTLNQDERAVQFHSRWMLRIAFNGFRIALMQTSRTANMFARRKRLTKRDVLVDWKDFIRHKRKAGFMLGKLMIHANKRVVQPAFDMLRRQDVVLDGRERIANIRAETNTELAKMAHNMNGKSLYSMFRIVKQNHKASKAKCLRVWVRAVAFVQWEESAHRRVAMYLLSKRLRGVWSRWCHLVHKRKLTRNVIQLAVHRNEDEVTYVRLQKGYSAFTLLNDWCLRREQATKTIASFAYRQGMNLVSSALFKWSRRTRAIHIEMSLGYRMDRFAKTFRRRVR
jgi:hypothetical protein